MTKPSALLGLLLLAPLLACQPSSDQREGQSGSENITTETSEFDQEEDLLSEPDRALPELERRLRERLNIQNHLLIVDAPDDPIRIYALPRQSPWVLTCGLLGISVVFGSAVSGSEGSASNDVEIVLSRGLPEKEQCRLLVPALGSIVETFLQEGE